MRRDFRIMASITILLWVLKIMPDCDFKTKLAVLCAENAGKGFDK